MERVDTILSGGIVVTMNQQFDIIHDGALAVRGGKIIAIGSTQDILAQFESDDVVSCAQQYLLPGLINAHTHVPMTLVRGLADAEGAAQSASERMSLPIVLLLVGFIVFLGYPAINQVLYGL